MYYYHKQKLKLTMKLNNEMKKHLLFFFVITSILLQSCGKKTEETTPIRKDVTESVFASGVLEAKNTYYLTSQVDGYLVSINFNEGDVVQKGFVLAVVDNKESTINTESAAALLNIAESNTKPEAPLLEQAKNNIEIAKQKMEQDAIQEQRYRKLWETNSIAKVDYENVLLQYNNSKTNYETTVEAYKNQQQTANQQVITNKASKNIYQVVQNKNQIRAVVHGKVYKKYKQQGDYVKRGDVIAEIGSEDVIYAKVNIDESYIAKIEIGQQADVQLNINKNKVYKATVSEIMPSFDNGLQSFLCKLYFNEPLDFKIVNTQLQSNIIIGTTKNALLIPRNYIDEQGYVQLKGEKEKKKVKTGFISNNWVQILDGINENTVLITDNISANKTTTSEIGTQKAK